jgi:hypothetical protein
MVLIDGKRVGLSNAMCAARAGISEAILYRWLQHGREQREQGRHAWPFDRESKNWRPRSSPRESKEVELLEAMERAEGDRLAEALLHIREAAKGGAVTERVTTTTTVNGVAQTTTREKVAQPDWKAAAWLAERTRRQDYGVTRTEVTGADGGPLVVSTWADVVRQAAAEEAEQEAADRKKKGGG